MLDIHALIPGPTVFEELPTEAILEKAYWQHRADRAQQEEDEDETYLEFLEQESR